MEARVRDNRRSRATVKDESGQVIMLAALAMAAMLVMVAFVVDIGKAYLVQGGGYRGGECNQDDCE